jgi:hypothetical protein
VQEHGVKMAFADATFTTAAKIWNDPFLPANLMYTTNRKHIF